MSATKLEVIRLPMWTAVCNAFATVIVGVRARNATEAFDIMREHGYTPLELPARVHNPDRKPRKERIAAAPDPGAEFSGGVIPT